VYFGAVVVLVVAMLGVSYVLGERQQHPESKVPYEGGITSEGSARVRLSARFYLIAMFFVLFDLEAVYLFSWAVAAREAGWAGFLEVAIFVAVLLAALVWLWRIGALDLAALRVGPPKEIPKHAPTRQRDA
jgi:NADH-quinone oxidoreductase subunit A